MKFLIRTPALYQEPKTDAPPPWWIRGLLILTCTGVSFAHGGNDGQKGMGLIMLILIGAAPTAYALNRTMPDAGTPAFVGAAPRRRRACFAAHAAGAPVADASTRPAPRSATRCAPSKVDDAAGLRRRSACSPATSPARCRQYGSLKLVPAADDAEPAQRHVPGRRRAAPARQGQDRASTSRPRRR